LVQRADGQGVAAQSKLVAGEGWLEIIREVLRGQHDLVVIGTRDRTGLQRVLFGNVAMKLLRRCPCPVMVAKAPTFATGLLGTGRGPDGGAPPLNILVATDLKPASDEALRLGIALAGQLDAHVHVLHVVEYHLDEVCNVGLPDSKQAEYRRQVRAQAERALQAQLARTDYQSLGGRLEVHLGGDIALPDAAIGHFIEGHDIHLLVMGTIGRGGIPGITIGNTAERLLPGVHCSVLAVKPPSFVCPVVV
jgi:nucleotide-binding universal stress UspA family protein